MCQCVCVVRECVSGLQCFCRCHAFSLVAARPAPARRSPHRHHVARWRQCALGAVCGVGHVARQLLYHPHMADARMSTPHHTIADWAEDTSVGGAGSRQPTTEGARDCAIVAFTGGITGARRRYSSTRRLECQEGRQSPADWGQIRTWGLCIDLSLELSIGSLMTSERK